MEILKFLKWWWDERDGNERAVVYAIAIIFYILIVLYFFGLFGFVISLFTAVVIFSIIGLVKLYSMIMQQWERYTFHREAEHQRTVNKLAGRTPLSETPGFMESFRRKHRKV